MGGWMGWMERVFLLSVARVGTSSRDFSFAFLFFGRAAPRGRVSGRDWGGAARACARRREHTFVKQGGPVFAHSSLASSLASSLTPLEQTSNLAPLAQKSRPVPAPAGGAVCLTRDGFPHFFLFTVTGPPPLNGVIRHFPRTTSRSSPSAPS